MRFEINTVKKIAGVSIATVASESVGSKSSNHCKKAGVKLRDLFTLFITLFIKLNDFKKTLAAFLLFYRLTFHKS